MLVGFIWSRFDRNHGTITPTRDWVPTKSNCINHNSGLGYCYKDCPVCGDDDGR